MDVSAAVTMLAGTIGLVIFGGGMVAMLEAGFKSVFKVMCELELKSDVMPLLFKVAIIFVLQLVGPLMLLLLAAGILGNMAQTGWMFAPKSLEPKLSAISPGKGFKRIFSSRGAVELVKGIIKIVVVGFVGYLTLKAEIPGLILLMDQEVAQLISAIGRIALKLAFRLTIAFAILAAADYGFQRWKFMRDMRMTKQEIKEEYRQTEGDPQIKGKIRQTQLKMSMNRMIKAVPTADFVLANPVHLAVALKYDPATMRAPQVVAKGKNLIAERIKSIARENRIPVFEEPELARAIYKASDVGWEIPYDLYQAVAEILAMVYRLKEAA